MTVDPDELAAKLADGVNGQIERQKCLAPFTSYKIGGPADIWIAPTSERDVGRCLEILHAHRMPLFVLGRGSNLLVSDQGWRGAALYLGENFSQWSIGEGWAEIRSGTLLMDLVNDTVKKGLAGMELLAGIPGGLGGALRMNAGAFGQTISKVTTSVNGFNLDGTPVSADRGNIGFDYRKAPGLEHVVITSALLRFKKEKVPVLEKRVRDTLALRAAKQPLNYPSCGSVFKRPPGYYAGALIEETGLKGKHIGGAMISRKHGGFILNVNHAKAADVYALIRLVETRVLDRFGVRLEREVKLIGEF